MIWFRCKQCGKKQSRPEDQVGTLVFCPCGQSNRVPWESEAGAAEAAVPQPFPKVWVDESSAPPRSAPSAWGRPQPPPQPTPGFCFNHPDDPATHACDACLLEFCNGCHVQLAGQTLCGPCKNFRVLGRNRPAHVSGLAIIALVMGLVGGPISTCVTIFGANGMGPGAGAMVMAMLGLVLPAAAMLLAIKALLTINANSRVGGRALAVTGLIAGLAGALWCASVIGILVAHELGG